MPVKATITAMYFFYKIGSRNEHPDRRRCSTLGTTSISGRKAKALRYRPPPQSGVEIKALRNSSSRVLAL
jgi:hypothetical protein